MDRTVMVRTDPSPVTNETICVGVHVLDDFDVVEVLSEEARVED